ncbi:SseB family protein [Mangrovactinospora gilvigrisea]|uniref:SseB family protein n=1 Tax=Mangrovactinospora gilvigrisea TaxID=1428644 RepID=UPI000A4CEAAF|nr:SseB family protein [Mangrovactinospora gilvigrisea]
MYGYERTTPSGGPQGPGAHNGAQYGGGYEAGGGSGYGYPQGGGYQDAGQNGYQGQGGYGYPPPQQGAPQQGGAPEPGRYPEPQGPTMADALRAFAGGAMTAEDFQEIFIASRIYCPRADTPGFLAMPNTNQPLIPMFTSLKELRRFAGKESKYFVITGAEVLDLLPTGYGFVLDVEGDHRAVFDARAVEEMVDFTMRRLYG